MNDHLYELRVAVLRSYAERGPAPIRAAAKRWLAELGEAAKASDVPSVPEEVSAGAGPTPKGMQRRVRDGVGQEAEGAVAQEVGAGVAAREGRGA